MSDIKIYQPRFTIPEKGNKYYNTISVGGYSTCILGNYPFNSVSSNRTGYPGLNTLPNCVGYAMGRFNEIGDYKIFKYKFTGDAESWFNYAKAIGLETGQEPKLGGIMCWSVGIVGNRADGAGHVVVVEQLNSDGTIITSDSGWNTSKPFWNTTRSNANGRWGQSASYKYLGCIYNPAVPNSYTIMKKGAKGACVKELQKKLNIFGWYDLVTDGSFGPATENAVKDFQKKMDITVDGSAGLQTQTLLDDIIELPKSAKWLTVTVNGKDRQMMSVEIDGHNYIRTVDMEYQLNIANVGYNSTTKKPFINK